MPDQLQPTIGFPALVTDLLPRVSELFDGTPEGADFRARLQAFLAADGHQGTHSVNSSAATRRACADDLVGPYLEDRLALRLHAEFAGVDTDGIDQKVRHDLVLAAKLFAGWRLVGGGMGPNVLRTSDEVFAAAPAYTFLGGKVEDFRRNLQLERFGDIDFDPEAKAEATQTFVHDPDDPTVRPVSSGAVPADAADDIRTDFEVAPYGIIQQVFDFMDAREPGIFTLAGEGGVGKTTALGRCVRQLQKRGREQRRQTTVLMAAATGRAASELNRCACSMDARTVHSLLRLRTRSNDNRPFRLDFSDFRIDRVPYIVEELHDDTKKDFECATHLVLDEAFFMTALEYDTLSLVLSLVRGDPRAFGGLTVVTGGDGTQLPPVDSKTDLNTQMAKRMYHSLSIIHSFAQNDPSGELLMDVFERLRDALAEHNRELAAAGRPQVDRLPLAKFDDLMLPTPLSQFRLSQHRPATGVYLRGSFRVTSDEDRAFLTDFALLRKTDSFFEKLGNAQREEHATLAGIRATQSEARARLDTATATLRGALGSAAPPRDDGPDALVQAASAALEAADGVNRQRLLQASEAYRQAESDPDLQGVLQYHRIAIYSNNARNALNNAYFDEIGATTYTLPMNLELKDNSIGLPVDPTDVDAVLRDTHHPQFLRLAKALRAHQFNAAPALRLLAEEGAPEHGTQGTPVVFNSNIRMDYADEGAYPYRNGEVHTVTGVEYVGPVYGPHDWYEEVPADALDPTRGLTRLPKPDVRIDHLALRVRFDCGMDDPLAPEQLVRPHYYGGRTARARQFCVDPAFASTVHKFQGATLGPNDRFLSIWEPRFFTHAVGYVCATRGRLENWTVGGPAVDIVRAATPSPEMLAYRYFLYRQGLVHAQQFGADFARGKDPHALVFNQASDSPSPQRQFRRRSPGRPSPESRVHG